MNHLHVSDLLGKPDGGCKIIRLQQVWSQYFSVREQGAPDRQQGDC